MRTATSRTAPPDDPEVAVRFLLDALGEDGRDVGTLHRLLGDRGWPARDVEDVIGHAVRSGRVFEDCRRHLQASPHTL